MSYFQVFVRLNISFILLFCLWKREVLGDKLKDMIYRHIKAQKPCVTLLNATHQIGCTSKRKGNVGILHYVESDEDLTWLLLKGKHAPYVALFTPELFTRDRLKRLTDANKLAGALVAYGLNRTDRPSAGYSPEYPCPNEDFGVYSEEKYSCRRGGEDSVVWNKNGSGLSYQHFDIPMFFLFSEEEILMLKNCYRKYNKPRDGKNPDYPLCGVKLSTFMFAAKDTPTCMRKGSTPTFTDNVFCDPLGDKNVWGTLFPLTGDKTDKVILATAKLDSSAFFHDLSFGADDATGIITLLAAADVLGRLKNQSEIKAPKGGEKHIMFSFFQGETWDYIGSSRMVYDMERGKFPCYDEACNSGTATLNLSNFTYYLELSQVALLDEGALWAHSDPHFKTLVGEKTMEMFETLSGFGASNNVTIKNTSDSKPQPLPPASFQRFLRSLKKDGKSIPGLVVADHRTSYTNLYYNSRFDYSYYRDAASRNETINRLTSLATAVAHTLLKLAYNKTVNDTKANETLVKELFYCILETPNCFLFKKLVTKKQAKNLGLESYTNPFSRYVGTYKKSGGGVAPITGFTKSLLTFLTGTYVNTTECDKSDLRYSWLEINKSECIRGHVHFSPALSPAFDLRHYDSREYSTWTESRWGNDVVLSMFLVADPIKEIITLAVGIVVTLISFIVTIFVYRKAEQLFSPGDRVLVISDMES